MSTVPAPSECGCEEERGLSRRGFLRGAALVGAAVALPSVSTRYAFAAEGASSAGTLVVLSLRGGFDGLSAFAPVADPLYASLRPGIGLPASTVLQLDPTFGMHPGLAALKPLWDAGQMALVHDVGTPDATRSHFSAQEELERAAPGSNLRTGWLDRVLDLTGVPSAFTATQVGSGALPLAMVGPNSKMAVRKLDGVKLEAASWVGPRMLTALTALHKNAPTHLAASAAGALSTLDTATSLQKNTPPLPEGVVYPKNDFGVALRDVARLIKGNVGLRIATLDLGDWDMHSGLGKHDNGWMARKLTEFAAAMTAFAADLGPRFASTNVVTLSEFGRRVAENGSGGVDHGHGNAVMLFGGGLVGGVHGRFGGLGALDRGDLPGVNDYRDILGELLTRRLGVADLSKVFPGHKPSFLGLARAA